MTCIKEITAHVGFISEVCEHSEPTKFWCVREMKNENILFEKKEREIFPQLKLGEWFNANLLDQSFDKTDVELPTRINEHCLEVQAPLIVFENHVEKESFDFDGIQQGRRRGAAINPTPHRIGFVPGLGRVGVFLNDTTIRVHDFYRVWVTKINHSNTSNGLNEFYEKNEIDWVVTRQEPEQLELIDMLGFRHVKLATGIVVYEDGQRIKIWNETYGLYDRPLNNGELYEAGSWIKFVSVTNLSGMRMAGNIMPFPEPSGIKKTCDKIYSIDNLNGYQLQLEFHLIRMDPAVSQHYYVEGLGAIDDPKKFLRSVNSSTFDPTDAVFVSFDMEEKIWVVENILHHFSTPNKTLMPCNQYQILVPPSIYIPLNVKVVETRQKILVKVPKILPGKILLTTTFVPAQILETQEHQEDLSFELESFSENTDLSIFDHSIPSATIADRKTWHEVETLLYKIYLYQIKGFRVPENIHDFFLWLKVDFKVPIDEDYLCYHAWNKWNLFLSMHKDGVDFNEFMEQTKNEIKENLLEHDFEEISSPTLSYETVDDYYDTLGFLLRKLYLFQEEGYTVPETEESFVNWVSTNCNGLDEEFCEQAWKMWKLLKLALHNEEFKKKLDAEFAEIK